MTYEPSRSFINRGSSLQAVGQSDADIVRQINKMYRLDMDATSTTMEPAAGLGSGDDEESRALAGGGDYDTKDPRAGGSNGVPPKSLRVRGSAAARGVMRVYNAIARCLRDDRIEGADEETLETFRRINAKNDESFPCLKKILNVCFVTIGVILFVGVIAALIYATIIGDPVHLTTIEAPHTVTVSHHGASSMPVS